MTPSLAEIKNIDHDTLVSSGNIVYLSLLEELEKLRALQNISVSSVFLSDVPRPLYIKTFPDGRRLVYRVSMPCDLATDDSPDVTGSS
ncbi:hypothetical protein H0H92_016145 [Tricholoma furcatifolium]|nr:hypothetical protein H0H92_016145 [Tricholoma furcatifolium]